MAEIANAKITAAIAVALLGTDRANRCQDLTLVLSPGELPQVMATFLLTAEEAQDAANVLHSATFQLVQTDE